MNQLLTEVLAGLALVGLSVLARQARRAVDHTLGHRVDIVPVLMLRLARRLLPATDRDEIYPDWEADLDDMRHNLTGGWLVRQWSCTRFSLGCLRSGRTVAAIYRGLREDSSPDVRLGLVQHHLDVLRVEGDIPRLRQRHGLRFTALRLRDLLRLSPRAFTAGQQARLVATAAVVAKFCVDDRDERLGQELVDAAWAHADDLGSDHAAVLQLLHTTGYLALQLGDYDEAGKILGDVADRLTTAFGEDHPAALEAQRLQAWNLQEQGQLDEAERGLVTILEALEQTPNADPAQRLHVQCMLGWTQCQQAQRKMRDGHTERAERRFDESEVTYDAVIFSRGTLLGPDHHDTLDARHSLGKVVLVRGDWRRAHDFLRLVVVDRQRCLGSDHPDTLESRKYTALAAAAMLGDRRQAMNELRRILDKQTRLQGPFHPNTIDTRRWLDTLQETT